MIGLNIDSEILPTSSEFLQRGDRNAKFDLWDPLISKRGDIMDI